MDRWSVDELDGRGGALLFAPSELCCRGHGDARIMSSKDRFDWSSRAGVHGGTRADGGYALSGTEDAIGGI